MGGFDKNTSLPFDGLPNSRQMGQHWLVESVPLIETVLTIENIE